MTTEPLPIVYARLARKVDAQTAECLNVRYHWPDDSTSKDCPDCHGISQLPDPKYAALREMFWRACPTVGNAAHNDRHIYCSGTGRVLRPLDELDAGELAEAMRCIGTPVACEIREHDAAAWFGNEGEAFYYHLCPTLLEALIRAADAAIPEVTP